MKLNYIIIITNLLCFAYISKGAGQTGRAIEIASKVDSVYKSIRNLNYRFKARKLYFMSSDTVTFEGECSWMRKEDDSLGYWVNIHQNNNFRVIYNGKQIIWIDENKKKIDISDTKSDGYVNFVGNTISLIIPSILNERNFLQSFVGSFSNPKVLRSEIIEGMHSIDLNTYFKPMDIVENSSVSTSLDKNTLLPIRYVSYAEMDNYRQYIEYSFDSLTQIKQDSAYFFLNKEQEKRYKITVNKKKAPEPLLDTGELAPSWQLPDLDGKIINSESSKGKIIVLDFWYMSCYPCLKMIPVLNEIDSLYKDMSVQIFGMNVYDGNREKVRDFTHPRMKYKTLLDALPVAEKYHISGYPTLYIIDRRGRIVYADIGYSSQITEKIKSVIEKIK
jgi:thiol-disulfide isomerase/thioredoxin